MEDTAYTMETPNGLVPIEKVPSEKDLGVTFDSKLNFTEHISSKVKKANQIVGLIFKQGFTGRNILRLIRINR